MRNDQLILKVQGKFLKIVFLNAILNNIFYVKTIAPITEVPHHLIR